MPDKTPGGKVITGLLTKPESRGPVTLKEVPWKDEDPLTRFLGGFIGNDDSGGGSAGLLGAIAGMANPFDDAVRGYKGLNSIAGVVKHEGPGYVKSALPQLEDAFDATGRLTPEVAAESARLMSEMIKNPAEKAAFQQFAKMNPAAAGHVQSYSHGSIEPKPKGIMNRLLERVLGPNNAGQAQAASVGPIKGFPEAEFQSNIILDPRSAPYKKELPNLVGHELQHGAQIQSAGRGWGPMYNAATKALGYRGNPYEVDANQVGAVVAKLLKEGGK